MCKKERQPTRFADFKDVTPDLLVEEKKLEPMYEEAFLSRDEKSTSEYAQNTTTWD